MFTVLSVLGLNLLGEIAKRLNMVKGGAAVHVFLIIVSLIITGIWQLAQANPSFLVLLEKAGTILVAAIGTYELVWRKVGAVLPTA